MCVGGGGGHRGHRGQSLKLKDQSKVDHGKSTLAKGSRWDYTPLPF